ncbi:MAG: hypothetical protein GY816_03925 [Cytophagales bacterium]|nr:hypothetical protein [Cytophagales bacterium]
MKTKVTLSLDEDFVKEAKRFAKSKNRSLSAQVRESVMKDVVEQSLVEEKLKVITKLAGSIKLPPEDANKTLDELRYEAMKDKYELP